jgi:hypothetical protein
MFDKKGGWRGCGRKIVLPAAGVYVTADDRQKN